MQIIATRCVVVGATGEDGAKTSSVEYDGILGGGAAEKGTEKEWPEGEEAGKAWL